MYKRPLFCQRSLCFTGKTDYNFDKWHEKSDYLEVPRDAKCWNMVPCISFDIISPGSYRLQKHRFVFNSQVLQSTSEEREVNLECYQESQHQNQTPKD